MKLVRKFLVAELVWGAGIFAVMAVVALLSSGSTSAGQFLQWLARALGLAALPAGITIASAVFDDDKPWRQLVPLFGAAAAVSALAFALIAVVGPAMSADARSLGRLAQDMGAAGESWETRNDTAWVFYTSLFTPLHTLLLAAIGAQVGIWARYSLPRSLRRPLYWAVGLGFLVTGYAISDTTYETIVLNTAADANFAAFYTLLIPASICAGLALPTLALLRRADFTRNPS